MSSITIRDDRNSYSTLVQDDFIDYFMPRANGEFVKIYLYLLRQSHARGPAPTLSSLADVFSCTEKDILRALRYWERTGLISLVGDGREIDSIALLPLTRLQETHKIALPEAADPEDLSESPSPQQPSSRDPRNEISSSRARALKTKDADARQILFITEQYIGRPLTPTDMRRILYFYDELHFPVDLVDYLVEYCVSHDGRNMNYIEKVGLAWHADGLDTVAKAKARTNTWKKTYFAIFKAFGIKNRNPIPSEKNDMDRWLTDYAFPLELIQEAASRTIAGTGQPSFHYTESILAGWHQRGVRSMDDVKKLDEEHRAAAEKRRTGPASPSSDTAPPVKRTGFHNFRSRDSVDYDQLQQDLLKEQNSSAKE